MSTQLTETAAAFEVSTVLAEGKRKKLGRGMVIVPKGDITALRAEIVRQAAAARSLLGIVQPQEEPVV